MSSYSNIKTIKSLKYFIADNYKENELCPCILNISIPFDNGNEFYFSDDNYTPEKELNECFPNDEIYVTINFEEKCNCRYRNLSSLSKIEIYENFIKEISQLKNKFISEINKRDAKIKELEDCIKDISINLEKNINNTYKKINYETNISTINNYKLTQEPNIIKKLV